jgi:hypothetical protein
VLLASISVIMVIMKLEVLVATTRVALGARIRNKRMVAFALRKSDFLHIFIMFLILRERCDVD